MRTCAVALAALLAASAFAEQPIVIRYSAVYDLRKNRNEHPDCPDPSAVREQAVRVYRLWREQGTAALERIRSVSMVPGYPFEPTVVYVVGCSTGISDPVTVSVFMKGLEGWKPTTDRMIVRDITHELLHQVADLPKYDALQNELRAKYPDETPMIANHILQQALEARIYGYSGTFRYQPYLRRALELAKDFGLITEDRGPMAGVDD